MKDIDEILLDLKKTSNNYRKLLQSFFRKLYYVNIKLTEIQYSNMKNSSKILKEVLEKLGIMSFSLSEIVNYLNGSYDFYLKLKPYNISLEDMVKIIDYYLRLLGLKKEYLEKNSNSLEYQKLELIIKNYDLVKSIHALYKEMFTDYSSYALDKSIISMPLNKLKELLDNMYLYKCEKIDNAFMDNFNVIYMDDLIIQNIFERFFKSIPGISEAEGKKLLKKLFYHYDYEARKRIIMFTNHSLSGRTKEGSRAWNSIQTMQKQYRRYIVQGEKEAKTLEDYFPIHEGIDKEHQNRIRQKLIATIHPDRRKDIDLYVTHQVTAKSLAGNRARSTIQVLQKQYDREIKKINGPILTYYDAFIDIESISGEEKRKIVDYVIGLLPIERQINLKKYIMHEIKQTTEVGKVCKIDLQTARVRYKKIAQKGLLNRTVYTLFPNIEGVEEEEKIRIIDILLNDISIERQTNIKRFVELEINSSSTEGKQAYNDIKIKQRQFVKYIEERKNFVNKVALVIKEKYGIIININISFAKIDLLFMAVRIIEFIYRLKNKKTKKEFQLYLNSLIEKIYEENPDFDFENLLESFIDMAYENLKEDVLVKL